MKQINLAASGINRRVFLLTTIFLALLVFFIYLKFTNDNIVFDIIMYALIILSWLWGVGLNAIIKTRITMDKEKLRAPYYVWHEDFKFDIDKVVTIKSVFIDQILSISLIEVSNVMDDLIIKAIKLKIKDSYDLCILLDTYTENDVNRVFEYIQNNIKKLD
jgi:hypothetical protein